MATLALGLMGVERRQPLASMDVLVRCHGFEMSGIHAMSDPTQVVQL